MRIGIPKEIKTDEKRVGLIAQSVRELTARGHQVGVETGAGLGIGQDDGRYREAGAEIASDAAEVFQDMLRQAKKLRAVDAHEAGIVAELAESYEELIQAAVKRVRSFGKVTSPTPDGTVAIAPPGDIEPVAANGLPLSSLA